MEAVDFIASGIAGFRGFARGAQAKTGIAMTKLYLVQLAMDQTRFVVGKNYVEARQNETRAEGG